jgi:diaminopimelate decarboxylase
MRAKAFLLYGGRAGSPGGLGLDVCTGGELAVAVTPAGRPHTMHSNKSTAELAQYVEAGVGRIVDKLV